MLKLTKLQTETLSFWGDILGTFSVFLGITAALIGLCLAWKRMNHAEKLAQSALLSSEAANTQAENSRKQLEHLTERSERISENELKSAQMRNIELFVDLLDKVGSEDKLVRVGAYFGLSALSSKSDEFYNFLSQIYGNALTNRTERRVLEVSQETFDRAEQIVDEKLLPSWEVRLEEADIEVQAVFDAFGQFQGKRPIAALRISRRLLRGIDFTALNMSGCAFTNCEIVKSSGHHINFKDTIFTLSGIRDCKFSEGDFSGANFTGLRIHETCFENCKFYGSDFLFTFITEDCSFKNSTFDDCELTADQMNLIDTNGGIIRR